MTTPTLPFARAYELRVKALSLAAEARIIKSEERRLFRCNDYVGHIMRQRRVIMPSLYAGHLQAHRVWTLRKQARLTHLARAFISGTPYAAVERPGSKPFDVNALRKEIWAERVPPFEATRLAREKALMVWFDPKLAMAAE